jgi:hypothetical protein
MKLDLRVVGAVCAFAVALIVVGLIVGRPSLSMDGAYLNNGNGTPTAGMFIQTGSGLFDPADGNLWIGAGVAVLLAAGLLVALVSYRRASTRADNKLAA